jgi:hypothetical protein
MNDGESEERGGMSARADGAFIVVECTQRRGDGCHGPNPRMQCARTVGRRDALRNKTSQKPRFGLVGGDG